MYKSVATFFLLFLPFGVSLGQSNVVHITNISDQTVTITGSTVDIVSKLGHWDAKSNQCKITSEYRWSSTYNVVVPTIFIGPNTFPFDSAGKPYTCVINHYKAHPSDNSNKISNVITDQYELYSDGNAYIDSNPSNTNIVITYPSN